MSNHDEVLPLIEAINCLIDTIPVSELSGDELKTFNRLVSYIPANVDPNKDKMWDDLLIHSFRIRFLTNIRDGLQKLVSALK